MVDLFCGAGGLAHGFRLEGFEIAAGADLDPACRLPFERNNGGRFLLADVAGLDGAAVGGLFAPDRIPVLVGSPPCQPFSTYTQGRRDPRWRLLEHFARIAAEARPAVVALENVPRLARFRRGQVLARLLAALRRLGYSGSWSVESAADHGVPQRRERLVLLASRLGRIALDRGSAPPAHRTVADAIGGLPPLAAGGADPRDPLHRSSRLSAVNLARIRASRPGGSWREWDEGLVAACHRDPRRTGYAAVYGRMAWDAPAPTITTQFYGFGCGRFGHPEQDRALSLREGALLQAFPPGYAFAAPGDPVRFQPVGRLIGNAVPVPLARAVARCVRRHLAGSGG